MFNWKYATFASFFISTLVVKLLLNPSPCCFKNALNATKCGPVELAACQSSQWRTVGGGKRGLALFQGYTQLLGNRWSYWLKVELTYWSSPVYVRQTSAGCVCVCVWGGERERVCAHRRTRSCTVCKPRSVKVINDCGDSRDRTETLSCGSACTQATVTIQSMNVGSSSSSSASKSALQRVYIWRLAAARNVSALAHIMRPQRVAVVTAILANSGFIALIAIFTRLMWSVSLEACVFWIALSFGSTVISEKKKKKTNKKKMSWSDRHPRTLVWWSLHILPVAPCGFPSGFLFSSTVK